MKVCTALDEAGIRAVLTGGSAATIYAPEVYQSHDADFIAIWSTKRREFNETLHLLGFREKGRIFAHSDCPYTLDFPDEDIMVGHTLIREFGTLLEGELHLHVLKPVHCVCDRLASFFWFGDRSALRAAVAVAVQQDIALHEVESWAVEHGEQAKFAEFKDRVMLQS